MYAQQAYAHALFANTLSGNSLSHYVVDLGGLLNVRPELIEVVLVVDRVVCICFVVYVCVAADGRFYGYLSYVVVIAYCCFVIGL